MIELIVSIVIISVGLMGVMSVFSLTAGKNVNPLIEKQALAIAQSYMDEILAQSYSGAAASSRDYFNNVDNYNNLLDYGAKTQEGVAITGFSQYTVSASVSAPQTLAGGVMAKMVKVEVSGLGGVSVSLVGYKANY